MKMLLGMRYKNADGCEGGRLFYANDFLG